MVSPPLTNRHGAGRGYSGAKRTGDCNSGINSTTQGMKEEKRGGRTRYLTGGQGGPGARKRRL